MISNGKLVQGLIGFLKTATHFCVFRKKPALYLYHMQQRLNFITIGVHDLDGMKRWYMDVFGWQPSHDADGIVFFTLNGFILGLFPVDELAADIGITNNGQGFKRFTLAVNFLSEQEVNEQFDVFRKKGVTIIKEPQKVYWGGYSGYIADPENNYWELAFNPFLQLDEKGNVLK